MTYRIISFDGGGVRGILPLVLLSHIQEKFPNFIDQTNLFAGTSVGGLIALALAQEQDVNYMLARFQKNMNEVFSTNGNRWLTILRGFFRAKYRSDGCEKIFHDMLGRENLSSLAKKVVITAFDLDNKKSRQGDRHWEPVVFTNLDRTNHQNEMSLVQVAMCTSAAPVYFPSYRGYIDGGVVASNPALVALIQTQSQVLAINDRPSLDEVVLLSFGTGSPPSFLVGDSHDWGYLRWSWHLIDAMYDGSVHLVDQQCHQLLGPRYHRLSPIIPGRIRSDQGNYHELLADIACHTDLNQTLQWVRESWVD